MYLESQGRPFAQALTAIPKCREYVKRKVSVPNIMLISTEWLALATAAIGVGGTLAGAAITQAFATKRESRQWSQSRESQAQLWEREDSLRFHDDKRIAYSTFIGKMHLWSAQMHSQLHEDYGGQAYAPDGFNEFQSDVMELMAQLELIAPPKVWTAAEVLWGAGAAIALTLALPDMHSKEKREKNISDFTGHLLRCISAMREDLATGRSRFTGGLQASHRESATSMPKRAGEDDRQQPSTGNANGGGVGDAQGDT